MKKVRTNWDRAQEGLQLCTLMHTMTGVDDIKNQISDAIAHLMHTARMIRDEDGNQIDFEDCLTGARINFYGEINEEPDL